MEFWVKLWFVSLVLYDPFLRELQGVDTAVTKRDLVYGIISTDETVLTISFIDLKLAVFLQEIGFVQIVEMLDNQEATWNTWVFRQFVDQDRVLFQIDLGEGEGATGCFYGYGVVATEEAAFDYA